jgi:hypothetical protein
MTLHKITEVYTMWSSVCPNITSKSRTIATLKTSSNNIGLVIKMKLVIMPVIFYCTKLHLSNCNDPRVVSVK